MMHDMTWYAKHDEHMQRGATGRGAIVLKEKRGIWQNLGNPSMPLDRLEDYDGNRYQEHEERMHTTQMVSKTICNANND